MYGVTVDHLGDVTRARKGRPMVTYTLTESANVALRFNPAAQVAAINDIPGAVGVTIDSGSLAVRVGNRFIHTIHWH